MLGRSQWPKADSQARQWLGLWVLALLVAASSSLLLYLISSYLHDWSSWQILLFSFTLPMSPWPYQLPCLGVGCIVFMNKISTFKYTMLVCNSIEEHGDRQLIGSHAKTMSGSISRASGVVCFLDKTTSNQPGTLFTPISVQSLSNNWSDLSQCRHVVIWRLKILNPLL